MREAPLTLYTEVGMILESYVVKKGNIEVIALVFARDRDRSLGMSCYLFGSPCHLMHDIHVTTTMHTILFHWWGMHSLLFLEGSRVTAAVFSWIYIVYGGEKCIVNQISFKKRQMRIPFKFD